MLTIQTLPLQELVPVDNKPPIVEVQPDPDSFYDYPVFVLNLNKTENQINGTRDCDSADKISSNGVCAKQNGENSKQRDVSIENDLYQASQIVDQDSDDYDKRNFDKGHDNNIGLQIKEEETYDKLNFSATNENKCSVNDVEYNKLDFSENNDNLETAHHGNIQEETHNGSVKSEKQNLVFPEGVEYVNLDVTEKSASMKTNRYNENEYDTLNFYGNTECQNLV
jgi:hypothetical protein